MPSVQTVLGEISAAGMGMTLPHEHLFVDLSCYWTGEARNMAERTLFNQPVTLSNRPQVLYNPWQFKDNTLLDDMDSAMDETQAFLGRGGKTIVDCTPHAGMGRSPEALRQVAGITGAHIIMAAGRYSGASLTEMEKHEPIEEITATLLDEFQHGAGYSGIKPGILKVAFEHKLDKQWELNSLRAAARAQNQLGCALCVHSNIWDCEGHRILDIIEEEGGDVHRTVLCHMDFTGNEWQYHDSLAKRGAFIEFDTFGCECVTGQNDWNSWYPTDGQKIAWVRHQIELGNQEKILMSGDMCQKVFMTRWGGWGYAHIPSHILPRMRALGTAEEYLRMITVENPQRVFAY